MPPPTKGDFSYIGGIFYRLHGVLSISFAQAYKDARGVQDAQLPDNAGFTIDDANLWYAWLGIYNSGLVPLDEMKDAIRQRMSFPKVPLDKQSPAYIQAQLRAAGFDVYVYKNKFDDGMGGFTTLTPAEILGIPVGSAIYGSVDYGEADYGETWATAGISLIVNYIEDAKDADFAIGDNYKATFYIAGATVSTFADVPEVRHIEFRQLILKYKSLQMVGIMFVNYV
jgi:hypothetical protein